MCAERNENPNGRAMVLVRGRVDVGRGNVFRYGWDVWFASGRTIFDCKPGKHQYEELPGNHAVALGNTKWLRTACRIVSSSKRQVHCI